MCQVAGDLAISQRCGQASGQFSRDLANPQVGAAGTSATDVVVAPEAQELATWIETNSGWPVSRQLANGQVRTMNSGPTRGDLTTMAGTNLAQLPRKEGGRASRPAMTTPSGGKIPEIT